MQISYQMVSDAHVCQLIVSLQLDHEGYQFKKEH